MLMARRVIPIITNETYHIFNRGIAGQTIYSSVYDYQRFIDLINYYRFLSPRLRFSFYRRLPQNLKQDYREALIKKNPQQVLIYAYCLMPNHYHFVIKELIENGVSKFIGNLQNSYAKYFNTRNKRHGSLFTEMFKNVRVENEEHFIHLARYIHLNPITSYIIKEPFELDNYPWSSFKYYLNDSRLDFLEKDTLLSLFKNIKELESFTKDQIDYQRTIHNYTHLFLD